MEAFLGTHTQWMVTGQGLSQVVPRFPLTMRALGGGIPVWVAKGKAMMVRASECAPGIVLYIGSKILLKINLSPPLFKHTMTKIICVNFYSFRDIIMGFNMAYVYVNGREFNWYEYNVIFKILVC